ncbi:hypothetical protein ACFQBQ_04520 [Granulicella cerasi]|uniref:Uncharacterized protein n=1 Tax=Granulicella cerasi TaxID=741063 RepID=A0ABW1Z7A6_9BACT|nr:hypothetical protein [Granulicella cerasi]
MGAPQVSLLLRSPRLWWAYLALISNAPLMESLRCYDQVVCFDHPHQLSAEQLATTQRTKFLLIFWDGISDDQQLAEFTGSFPRTLDVDCVLVGDNGATSPHRFATHNLYAEGTFSFCPKSLRLDAPTRKQLRQTHMKSWLVPVKNVLKRSGSLSEALSLLFGARRVVFCGGYGLDKGVLGMFADRYRSKTSVLMTRCWSTGIQHESREAYVAHYGDDLLALQQAYASGEITAPCLAACVRLLDREYCIRHLQHTKVPFFVNQFGQKYIDVYTTPFYKQHIFLDFGSTVGNGNYPRRADLSYYGKTMIEVPLMDSAEAISQSIVDGSHTSRLHELWAPLLQHTALIFGAGPEAP